MTGFDLSQADSHAFALRPTRMHEAEGPGRRSFALYQALHHPGPLFWFLRAHDRGLPFPQGLPPGVGERLYLVRAASEAELLWGVEEALRAAVALVVAEPQEPLSLTAGRRLQLAAKAGQATAIMLIRQDAGSNASETRWHCRPLPSSAGAVRHEWRLIRDKRGAPRGWMLDWDGRAGRPGLLSAVLAEPAPDPSRRDPAPLRRLPRPGRRRSLAGLSL